MKGISTEKEIRHGLIVAAGAGAAALLLAALLVGGCSPTDTGTTATTAELAASTTSVGSGSDLSAAPELAGLMAGLMPPRIPDGVEGFRCDPTPTITTTAVCGHEFPASIVLDWTGCAARLGDHHEGGTGPDAGATGVGMDGDVDVDVDVATSAGHASITNDVTVAPTGSCGDTATYTIARNSQSDVTTTETDGTSAQIAATISSTSTRQLSARQFAQAKTYDIARTDRDAAGATTRTTHLSGQVSESFDGSGATPVRLINGTIGRDPGNGTTATLVLTGVALPAPGVCRWPTAGTIVETISDGTSHTLVFGSPCGQATLDGATVTLPAHGIHLEGGRGARHGGGDPGHAPGQTQLCADGGASAGPRVAND